MSNELKVNGDDSDVYRDPQRIPPEIANEIWHQFFPRLANFARRKLGSLPRREMDEEDVAMSAIHSFFDGVNQGKFEIAERDDLWKLLATITLRKISKQQRRFFAEKRGKGKVRGESVFVNADNEHLPGLEQFADPRGLPEFHQQITLTCEELLARLNNDLLRQTAMMRMDGYSNQEISDKLKCSLARTKQRIAKIKMLWNQAGNETDS